MAQQKRNHDARAKQVRKDDAHAFIPEPESGEPVNDDFAEIVGEAFVASATSGEECGEDFLNAFVVEELGGPFVEELLVEDVPTDAGEPPPT